jgi:hypothetical protein
MSKMEDIVIHDSGSIVFQGSNATNLYRLMVLQKALTLEIRTGMKMTRGSALAAANRAMGTNYRRKVQAADALTDVIEMLRRDMVIVDKTKEA